MKIGPADIGYPGSLFRLDEPPLLTVSGPLEAKRVIAIVGSRRAQKGSLVMAHALAFHLARANVTVVSGGAVGVDRTAHEGAMKGGGATWVVMPNGRGEMFPPTNRDLFDGVERSSRSRMIWPFADGTPKDSHTPRMRNKVLVGLAEVVVVIQARLSSGSRNAATTARELGVSLFVVPGAPWDDDFKGSIAELVHGARPLWSIEQFFDAMKLPAPDLEDPGAIYCGSMSPSAPLPKKKTKPQTYSNPPLFRVDQRTWSADEKLVFSKLSLAPVQRDQIVAKTGLPTSSALTALLTLSLKDVVVEGPDGFFRLRNAL